MRSIRISSLKWTAALVCTLTGAILLIAPHQLDFPDSLFFSAAGALWGILYLLVGLALVVTMAFRLPWIVQDLIAGVAGVLLGLLSWIFAGKGMWIASVFSLISGIALWGTIYISRQLKTGVCCANRDLLSFNLGAGSLVSGLLMLFRPGLFTSYYYLPIFPFFWIFCAAFLACGAWLVGLQIYAWLQEPKADSSLFRWLNAAGHILTAGLAGIFLMMAMSPARMDGVLLIFGLVFLILAGIPYIGPRLDQNAPSLLSTRLAIILAMAAAIPLVLTVALISRREESMMRADALAQQQALASAIANGIDDYTGLHQDEVISLARNPDLMLFNHQDQVELLRSAAASYPDVQAFALFAADGTQLARSDSVDTHVSAKGFPVYENALNTLQPSHDVLISPVYHHPVVALGAPVLDESGRFVGLVTAALDSKTIGSYVAQHSGLSGSHVYLVDERGRVISSPDPEENSNLTDLSGEAPFKSLLPKNELSGSETYSDSGGEQLAGYARVSGLNWLVVVDRPIENALAGVYYGRDVAFNILIISLLATLVAGVLLARWATAPLGSLVRAVETLGTGDVAPAILRNKIVEVDQLSDAFVDMRDRLNRRTEERERAEASLWDANQALSQLNAELEDRVKKRTLDLQSELENRERAEQALESHLERQRQLLRITQQILAERDLEGVLQKIVDGACELTGARRGTAGHGYVGGVFQIGASSCAPELRSCPPEGNFQIERGGVYMRLLQQPQSLRLSEAELSLQPEWWGLPEGHGELHGLMGAPLTGGARQTVGMIMVTDKEQDGAPAEFSAEDEMLLNQLAAAASLALGHIEARQVAEMRAEELDAVFASMSDAVVIFDAKGNVVQENARLLQDYGYNLDKKRYTDFFDLTIIHYPDGKPIPLEERPYYLALQGKRTENLRAHLKFEDRERFISISAWPLYQGEAISGAVSLWHDETERELFLKQLEEQQALLEQRVEERTQDLSQEIEQRKQVEQALQKSLQDLQELNEQLDQQVEAVTIASQALEGARKMVEGERKRYQDLFDLAPDGYLVTDLEGKILEANQAAGVLLGFAHARLARHRQKLLVTFIALEDRKEFRNQLNEIQKNIRMGRVYQIWSFRVQPESGPTFDGEMTVLGIPGEGEYHEGNGTEPQLRWLIRDISSRKKAEEIVRLSTRRSAALAEISRAVIEAGYDYQGILDTVTQAGANLFGDLCVIRTASTDRQWLLLASYHIKDPVKSRNEEIKFAHALQADEGLTGKAFSLSEPVLLEDTESQLEAAPEGKEITKTLNLKTFICAPLRSHNQVFGVVTVGRKKPGAQYNQEDLDLLQTLADRVAQALTNVQLYQDLEHAYQEEQHMRAQLIQAEKQSALSRMVASVAHELNNPIQTVQNCLYLISSDLPKTAELQEYLEMAVSEAKRVSSLVSQLRESYRPSQAGTMQVVELNQLLNQVEMLLAPHLSHQKVSWRQEPKRAPVLVEVIPDQMKQVFLNICLNAIEAMQPGGGVLDVSLEVDKAGKTAQVRFRDHGPGIPPDTQKKLFEPFFTTKPTGTGLGLSISYEIVSRHGGDISVESSPGEGACFTVKIPLAEG